MALQRDKAGKIRHGRSKPAPRAARVTERKTGREHKEQAASSFWSGVDWGKVRIYGLCVIFGSLWLVLWARAFEVQMMLGPAYAEKARRNHMATELVTGKRGNILDRKGNILARSVEARSVFVRPGEIEDTQGTAKFLAETLKMPLQSVRKQLSSNKGFVWIGRKVDPVLADAVRAGKRRGVYITTEFERVYPFKHMAGQLLGFVDMDDKGIEGLELAFEERLAGQSSRQVLQRDAAGRRLYTQVGDNFDDLTGEDLRLTLDSEIQFLAESALAEGVAEFGARWAGCLVVDVPTGDILAWAEYPFFNPNSVQEFSAFERRNKLATDALEQGSTVKPFLMAAALQEGVVRPDTEFDCEKGRWKLRNVTIRDTSVNETLTAHEILQVSSNIGVAKIGLSLGAGKYYDYLSRMGFGRKNGLPLAGEHRGILRSPGQWTDVDLASASFGQGFAATGLQMAQAYLTLVNGGVVKPLRLVLDDLNASEAISGASAEASTDASADGAADGDAVPVTAALEGERVFNAATVKAVHSMLRDAVEEKRSTGWRARVPGIHVGGKTGTAQKASGTTYGDARVSSFVGFAPLENPRYLVFVVFDEPKKSTYGGVVAAPVFRNVTMRVMAYHGVLPEGAAELAARENPASAPAAAGSAEHSGAGVEPAPGLALSAGLVQASRMVDGPEGSAPEVVGLTLRRAVEQFAAHGLVPQVRGSGAVVIQQSPAAGSPLSDKSGECILWLGERAL